MLTLPIKREWYDMIVSGEKKTEYKRICAYWQIRLLTARDDQGAPRSCEGLRVMIRAGYSKRAPAAILTLSGVDVGPGVEQWGAKPGEEYFRLHIDRVEVVK